MVDLAPGPRTPPLKTPHRMLFDSPFSDYFTDPASPSLLSPEPFRPGTAQKVLSDRLNTLGAQLLRTEPNAETAARLAANLDALEATLNAPEPQTREPAEIEDSGLFIDDEDGLCFERKGLRVQTGDRQDSYGPYSPVSEQDSWDERESIITQEAQSLLARLTKVTSELRDRYEEVRHLNQLAGLRLEESASEILRLRSENERLRANHEFDQSELLFLKLQFRALEVLAVPYIDKQSDKAFLAGIERWKADWREVDDRFRGRHEGRDVGEGFRVEDEEEAHFTLNSHTTSNGHIRSPRQKLVIKRPNSAARSYTAPLLKDPQTPFADAVEDERGNESTRTASRAGTDYEHEEFDEGESEEEPQGANRLKTPWEELWDSLTEYVGMSNDAEESD